MSCDKLTALSLRNTVIASFLYTNALETDEPLPFLQPLSQNPLKLLLHPSFCPIPLAIINFLHVPIQLTCVKVTVEKQSNDVFDFIPCIYTNQLLCGFRKDQQTSRTDSAGGVSLS